MKGILSLAALLSAASAAAQGAAQFPAQLGAGRQAVLAQAAATAWGAQERDVLVASLRDPEPEVRRQALRSLRHYVGQTLETTAAVLSVLGNPDETPEVRAQAAKTLSFVAGRPEVKAAFGRLASDPRTPPALRGTINKALYTRASGDPEVRAFLVQATNDPSVEGMAGALWALAQASHYPDVAELLLSVAARHPDAGIRAQAMRSIYRGAGRPEVRAALMAAAGDVNADPGVRAPAIMALSRVKSTDSQALLNAIARGEADGELRAAALAALDRDDERLRDYFYQSRPGFDPLDRE